MPWPAPISAWRHSTLRHGHTSWICGHTPSAFEEIGNGERTGECGFLAARRDRYRSSCRGFRRPRPVSSVACSIGSAVRSPGQPRWCAMRRPAYSQRMIMRLARNFSSLTGYSPMSTAITRPEHMSATRRGAATRRGPGRAALLLVKLRQMPLTEQKRLVIDTTKLDWRQGDVEGHARLALYSAGSARRGGDDGTAACRC